MAQNLHEFWLRVKTLFRKRRMDREMADELAFHQAMLKDKLMRQGVAREDADAAARRSFGNASRWHERLRELWQFRGAGEFWPRSEIFGARAAQVAGVYGDCAADTGAGRGREHDGFFD